MIKGIIAALLSSLIWPGFSWGIVLNNPYPSSQHEKDIYYTSFVERPKTLDPAKSYSSDEYTLITQIIEPLLEYDYLQRPFQLRPLLAQKMPEVRYLNRKGEPAKPEEAVAYTEYLITIKRGIYYQPHPAFAKLPWGEYRYYPLPISYLDREDINTLSDFKFTSTREVKADDFIYEIKRLASPQVSSPIYGLLSKYVVGFEQYANTLPLAKDDEFLDLRNYSMAGLTRLDDYSFSIRIKGQYPQFVFWLAMPFFAPIPWEVDRFYSQPKMDENNITLSWFPVGTGPYQLIKNNPNRVMVLQRNPHYRHEFYPESGSQDDVDKGYMRHAGKLLPLTEKVVFTLEKESIPRWSKFLQGYYDVSTVSLDSFDQAIRINRYGQPELTEAMKEKKVQFLQTVDPAIYYVGFNMLDPVVGGRSEKARKLRQAISIAINFDENIAIFYNGRGEPAQGPLPPGIFGYEEGEKGINPFVYQWKNGEKKRRLLSEARQLMREAGYPEGIDPKTGNPLILHYDVTVSGGPDDQALLDWMRKQFEKLGIALNIRGTQYNRFQEKMRTGDVQIFFWGWNGDYPDPENFLYQLYGPNGKVKYGGENGSNYDDAEYNRLFDLMKNRPNDEKRLELIRRMLGIVRYDTPWVFGIIPHDFTLSQQWVSKVKPLPFVQNTLQYIAVDVPLRNALQKSWNRPLFWPLILVTFLMLITVLPVFLAFRKKEKQTARRRAL